MATKTEACHELAASRGGRGARKLYRYSSWMCRVREWPLPCKSSKPQSSPARHDVDFAPGPWAVHLDATAPTSARTTRVCRTLRPDAATFMRLIIRRTSCNKGSVLLRLRLRPAEWRSIMEAYSACKSWHESWKHL